MSSAQAQLLPRASGKAGSDSNFEKRCVDTVRVLANDMVERAGSGHPGAPMALAPIAHVLWTRIMRYDARNPDWPARDRFVLSNGHAAALQYSMLHLTGYADLSMKQLQTERKLDSLTPGHPENVLTRGIETTTGPLGQGVANAVGMALAAAHTVEEFCDANDKAPLLDSRVYCLCGDGCLQEGISSEACSLAGTLGSAASRLTLLYDANDNTIDGNVRLAFTEDVAARFEAYGWHVQTIRDADHDLEAMEAGIRAAQDEKERPSLIVLRTTNGYGSNRQGTHKVHDGPLGVEDTRHVRSTFGFDPDQSFVVPREVADFYSSASNRTAEHSRRWEQETWPAYQRAHPEKASEFGRRFLRHELPQGWFQRLPRYSPRDEPEATRGHSGAVLAALQPLVPELIGGSADLTNSNKTNPLGLQALDRDHHGARYIHFGVREHGMMGICNGIAAFGGLIPYAGTFLNFFGYALGAIRLSALSHFRVIFVGTHDSIGVGPDGPTHQPVEMLESLRAMPNMVVIRPADGNETSAAWAIALMNDEAPTTLALARQSTPHLDGSSVEKALRGGYVLSDMTGVGTPHPEAAPMGTAGTTDPGAPQAAETGAGNAATQTQMQSGTDDDGGTGAGAGSGSGGDFPDIILLATGSEVCIAVDAAQRLVASREPGTRVRVVSMPCADIFERQAPEYRASVLPDGVPVLAVEASSVRGWERYAHQVVGVTQFGFSAPAPDVFAKLGLTATAVYTKAAKMLTFYRNQGHPVPTLFVNAPVF